MISWESVSFSCLTNDPNLQRIYTWHVQSCTIHPTFCPTSNPPPEGSLVLFYHMWQIRVPSHSRHTRTHNKDHIVQTGFFSAREEHYTTHSSIIMTPASLNYSHFSVWLHTAEATLSTYTTMTFSACEHASVHNSSLWRPNCCHRPANVDLFPLPPPLTVCSTLSTSELTRFHRDVCPRTVAVCPCGATHAGKAADCGFTYTVRLRPGPVCQLSGSSVKLHNTNTNCFRIRL